MPGLHVSSRKANLQFRSWIIWFWNLNYSNYWLEIVAKLANLRAPSCTPFRLTERRSGIKERNSRCFSVMRRSSSRSSIQVRIKSELLQDRFNKHLFHPPSSVSSGARLFRGVNSPQARAVPWNYKQCTIVDYIKKINPYKRFAPAKWPTLKVCCWIRASAFEVEAASTPLSDVWSPSSYPMLLSDWSLSSDTLLSLRTDRSKPLSAEIQN